MAHPKISFWIAVIVNINIVIGSAFFLGAQKISSSCGFFAPLIWLMCGALLLPLVIILTRLAKQYPTAGGLYVYSQKLLGPKWGMLSGWGYFIGTIAGNAVLIHAFAQYLQGSALAPVLTSLHLMDVKLDILFIVFFSFLTLRNVQLFEKAHIAFTILKTIPIAALLIGALTLFKVDYFTNIEPFHFDGFLQAFPMVFFAYIGIEACCAVVDQIKGHRNGHRVMIVSFVIIMLTYTILQALIFCAHGATNINPFLNILPQLTSNKFLATWGNSLIYVSILSSFLGGFYGMFYCNNWNVYAIAQNKNFIGSSYLTKLNKNGMPWVAIFTQSALLIVFLLITQSNHSLVTMSDFGVTIAYLLSSVAFLMLFRKSLLGVLSLLACSVFLYLSAQTLYDSGLHHVIPFLLMLIVGMIGYWLNKNQINTTDTNKENF